ncbi:MAG: PEP-CTERM sorting domain-containing protein [Opitutales bacterium]|nr:PEP-CTERM sorting domain-containing protein [Opitutales bacterium]
MIKLLFATVALLSGGVLFANAQAASLTYQGGDMAKIMQILQTKPSGWSTGYTSDLGDYHGNGRYLGLVSGSASPWDRPVVFDTITFTMKPGPVGGTLPSALNYDVYFSADGTSQVQGTANADAFVYFDGATLATITYTFAAPQTWTPGQSKTILGLGFKNTESWSTNGVTTTLSYKGSPAVPEPSAFGLLAGLGALALVASRRKRRFAK